MSRTDALYQLVLSLTVAVLVCLLLYVAIQLQDVQTQLEHIDSHFRAPEPTVRSEGVAG